MARKILLADDSVTAQNMGRKILSDAGYDVVTVNNGSAALKRVTEQKPDLIVLDVYMPGYSGLEVCQRLKDSPDTEAIPILLTVGKLEPFKPEEARRVRAEAYIVKPFEASELLSALTRLEDQIVPGHGKANGKSEGHGDSETGWKNRLRFPSKKKKEEPEPEPVSEFLAKPGSRADKNSSMSAAIPEIPRDITPEELDALSALAAKLDGESAQSSEPAEKAVGEPEVVAAAAPVVATDSKAEAPTESAPPAAETKTFEVVPVRVETLAQSETAPIDRDDEPMFAAAIAANESAETRDVKTEAVIVEQTASTTAPVNVQAAEPAEAPNAIIAETPSATTAETSKTEPEVPATGAVQIQQQETAAPSEAELAEALRLLTPSTVEASSRESKETEAVAVISAQEMAVNGSAPNRWAAVAVAVDPQEAALSLEAEMFQTLARPVESGNIANRNEGSALSSQERPAKTEDQTAEDEPAGVTFADAMLRDDESVKNAEPVVTTAPEASVPEASGATNSTNTPAGGGEAMGNEQAKSGKSNWHQIRTATPAARDAVEAAKQTDAEEPLKAMAAAADASRLAPTDPTAIASIVDSVLADLRPKIVEEISKKLSGK